METPEFKNYKEKQNYFKELYKNRGNTIHISKVLGRDDKVLQQGRPYTSEKGEIRQMKKQAKRDKNK